MATQIVKSLKFPNSRDTYQIKEVALKGKSLAVTQVQLDEKISTSLSNEVMF